MLKQLKIEKFTVFDKATFDFAKGVNVVVGSNGAGKSHLLKLAYTAARWSHETAMLERSPTGRPDKASLQKSLGVKLVNIFRPDELGRLSSRGQGNRRTAVAASFHDAPKATLEFSFSRTNKTDVAIDRLPQEFFGEESVFFPTKEMLSMFPGFASLYRSYQLHIDETYYDLCLALEKPLPKGNKIAEVKPLLTEIESVLGGSIVLDSGRFSLLKKGGDSKKGGDFEISLVAEGFRKLGALAYLLANGSLLRQSILFWDEPETNLNPSYMAKLAKVLAAIAKNGTQVFIATHSLYILRELSLLLQQPDFMQVERKFFALSLGETGSAFTEGTSAEEIEPIAALDAELEQSGRYLEQSPATE